MTVYTVRDVETRYDAGVGVLSIFEIALAVAGVLGIAWSLLLRRRSLRHERRMELAGLEPATSWVRSRRPFGPHSA